MANWVSLRNHSHFSLLTGVSRPKQMAKRCQDLGYDTFSLTDYRNIGCAVEFTEAMKEKGIKPILGCDFDVTDGDDKTSVVTVLAKNLAGWKSLIKSCSHSSNKENYKPNPHISLEQLAEFGGGNFIAITGYPGSKVSDEMFSNREGAYSQTNYDEVREPNKYINEDWARIVKNQAGRYVDIFGKENLFLSTEFVNPENNPAALVAARTMRWLSRKEGIQRVSTANSYYPANVERDASDQRVLLASLKKTTLKEMKKRIFNGTDWQDLRPNFMGMGYHIPSYEEVQIWNDEEEIRNTLKIAEMCESYDITNEPFLPAFPCPDGLTPDEYLSKLCRAGWSDKIYARVDENKWPEYVDRVRRELKVIKEAGLSSYFLIVQDYCNWARRQGMIVGPGRGSGAGCLVSYLIGITAVDPIEYGLIFERFYNAGRNSPGHISLPDIDCDFPVVRRQEIVAYLKFKFGEDRVANIATFNSLKGRGAVTNVLGAHGVPFELVKRITANIPQEARISEELQAMKERGEEPSIIRYALESDPDSYKDWVKMDDEGNCSGEYGTYFEQAMRLEGTKTNISRHAAGVVIGSEPLANMCPLVYDPEIDGYIAGMEMSPLEKMGQVKLDVLGVAALDKVMGFRSLLRYGYIDELDAA